MNGQGIKGRSYYKSSLVVVDEVGYTPISREECNLFFRFVANRYEKTSTIVTSNKAFSDWTETVPRSDHRYRRFRPAATSQRGYQYQRKQLSSERQNERK